MIIRLSQKLNTKIKAGKLEELPLDENPYADWSAIATKVRSCGRPEDAFKQRSFGDVK